LTQALGHDPDEAEIEASRAPLLEHLVELRTRLIICVAVLAVAFMVCFFYAGPIYMFLLHPFQVGSELLAAQKASGGHHGPFDLLLALIGLKEVPHAGTGTLKIDQHRAPGVLLHQDQAGRLRGGGACRSR
jgi:sec-independent protein translocase protein TatC